MCFVPTASADDPRLVADAMAALAAVSATFSILTLFPGPNVDDVTAHLLAQEMEASDDLIWPTRRYTGGRQQTALAAILDANRDVR